MSHTTKTNQILLIPATLPRQDDEALRRALESFGATLVGLSRGASQHQHLGYLLEGHCHWERGLDSLACYLYVSFPTHDRSHRNHMKSPSFKQSINTATFPQPDLDVDLIRFWILGSSLCNSASTGRGAGTTSTGRGWKMVPCFVVDWKLQKLKGRGFHLTISLWWTMFIHTSMHILLLTPTHHLRGKMAPKAYEGVAWNIIRWVWEGGGKGWMGFCKGVK